MANPLVILPLQRTRYNTNRCKICYYELGFYKYAQGTLLSAIWPC